MTAKEQLRAIADAMSEQQAVAALERLVEPEEESKPEWLRVLDEWVAQIPEEDLLGMPSSDRIDEVVYGHPPRE